MNVFLFDRVLHAAQAPPLKVTFFDVGQGDSIFFEFPSGGNLLVDAGRGGQRDIGRTVIRPYLESQGIRKIDAIVITHPQFDHAGGIASLIQKFDVGMILENGQENDKLFFRTLTSEIAKHGVRRMSIARGDELKGFDDTSIDFLHPAGDVYETKDLNNQSVVMRLKSYNRTFLLTGDIEEKGIETLFETSLERVDVLKVPHHGSKMDFYAKELLEELRPLIAVIQVGLWNRYGHPHPETLNQISLVAGKLYRTDLDGAVQIFVTREGQISVKAMIRNF